jgi:hypothetical protein
VRSAPAVDASSPTDGHTGLPDGAPDPDAAAARYLRVEALIDGRSRLILTGDTAQWLHLDYAAPGRHGGADEPTTMNGVDWYPAWPDEPTSENRNCECTSDVYQGPPLAMPQVPATVTLTDVAVRGSAAVVQLPAAGNDYTLVVELDDDPIGGSDTYVVDIEVTTPD